jgi:hypothetical protein
MMTRKGAVLALLVLIMVAAAGSVAAREIDVWLLLRPELEVEGTEKVFLGPMLLEPREQKELSERSRSRVEYAAPREFERYLYKLLRRETRLQVVDADINVEQPSSNLLNLSKEASFWQEIGKQAEVDYIIAASIDVEVLDRAGYKTEEYVSPEDGKTYFRQVLIEETGFSLDVLLMVFDATTGEIVHQDQITAFKERPENRLDEYADMYREIYNIENRLAGIFVPRHVRSKRYLYHK